MHQWTVAGGLVEGPEGLLLVRNRRRGGLHDWSPPGGVIDADDDDVVAGLTREVREETGITVTAWEGPVYEVRAEAPDMGWHLRAHVFIALEYVGALVVDDPDGIVDEAEFVEADACAERISSCHPWVREPLCDWIEARWKASQRREYRYAVHGTDPRTLRVERLGVR